MKRKGLNSRGRLNKAEEKELKRTCKSILNWVKVPAIPALPTPSLTINSVNITQEEEAYEMEWEEVWRGERVEKARSRKEKWEVARTVVTEIVEKATTESENGHVIQLLNETLQAGWKRIEEKEEKKKKAKEKKEEWEIKRIARQITTGVVEDAVSRSEIKHIENIVEDTLHEGWRRMETTRILGIMEETEEEVKERVLEACLSKKEEEKNLLAALRMEEERLKRLERTKTLKLILGKKLGAKRLRSMMNMMKDMSMEELGMEVEEVEDRAIGMMERMETCDDDDYQEEHKDTVVGTDMEKITSNNRRFHILTQFGQDLNQRSQIRSTPPLDNSEVEIKPTFGNMLFPDREGSPFSGQTGFRTSGLRGERKRKYELIRDNVGPDDNLCKRARTREL